MKNLLLLSTGQLDSLQRSSVNRPSNSRRGKATQWLLSSLCLLNQLVMCAGSKEIARFCPTPTLLWIRPIMACTACISPKRTSRTAGSTAPVSPTLWEPKKFPLSCSSIVSCGLFAFDFQEKIIRNLLRYLWQPRLRRQHIAYSNNYDRSWNCNSLK